MQCEDALHTMNNETLIVLTPDDKLVDFQASNKKNSGLETIRGAKVIDTFWPSSKWKMITDLHFPRWKAYCILMLVRNNQNIPEKNIAISSWIFSPSSAQLNPQALSLIDIAPGETGGSWPLQKIPRTKSPHRWKPPEGPRRSRNLRNG